ncbi:uncharacterized protein BKCO1_2000242 [Diplodia corticola]|uniref:NADAR domain-containing protein n=1 Tax=Diplodia corticola TaxID=236234 RepID=A0A1J9SJP5_9PEZI|nr:uncharacterized protein BKCO1_2000242 [Diplodia corticola]OJD39821.1 hypothetical protein BKCO1_2000242 [Diplodia corticola]
MSSTIVGSDTDNSPIYFWREYDEPYGFLSQWYDCAFHHGTITYRTAEMWMMAQKANLFGDTDIARQILAAPTPAKQKSLGRKVKNFDRKVWDENKLRIVEEGNWWKFTSSKEAARLADMLLATGDRELVEASPYDRIWGIGFAREHADHVRDDWGENLLGKALMKVRTRLRDSREGHSASTERPS